ncbi:hypothetical protein [Kocuria rhizophila]|uniref:arsenate reductase/protein-tyrosine-phosphatase family protein n=1 Tax=Kocuria rhizophila TaxID=72000 RepID=UPI0032AE95E9
MPHLLFVCHGNVARSPAAEIIAASLLPQDAGWTFSSAGIGALRGESVADDVASALAELGLDPSRHRARQVDPAMVAEADLVICMEREQRTWLVDETPHHAKKILVFGQAERLAALAPRHVAGLSHLVLSTEPAEAQDDVADPYRRGVDAARTAVSRIAAGLRPVLGLLAPGAQLGHPAPPARNEVM